MSKSETVRVVVRCRPLSEDEQKAKYKRIVEMDPLRGSVLLFNPKVRPDEAKREFTYDAVYDRNSKQLDLYDETFRPIVDAVLKGFNGTVFAYGQTGTGKTYTMEGDRDNPDKRGVIPNSFEHIFTHISRSNDEHYLVRASYLEIYLEEIRDLLSKDHTRRLDLKERPDTGVYVKDLSSFVAKSVKEIEHVMTVGNKNRSVGCTAMNEHSSRSHAIFIITVECSALREDGQYHIRAGKLNLVDLAGSERQSKTHATGDRFKEAAKINLSLSSLGNVISALVDGKSTHIPYRDSRLTRLLQDSLGGNAKTVMVANIGPAEYNYEETLSTLRYASRAKHITNKPRINEDPKDALLREYQDEIIRLKELLEKRKKKGKGKYQGSGSSVGTCDETESVTESDRTSLESQSLKEQQQQLEEQKISVLQNKELLSAEKEKLLAEVQSREKLLLKEQSKRDQLAAKITAMESKLLGGNVKDRSNEAKKALERKHQEVIEQKRKERQIRQELEKKEESNLELKGTYTSLQEEIDIKTKKLQKIKFKLKSARAEIADFHNEQMRIREELALTISNLQQEQKLRSVIIDNFISPDEVKKVKDRVVYKEEEEEWVLNQSKTQDPGHWPEARPVSTISNLYPVTTYARIAARGGDPRFMTDNILKIELDMPSRTTRDFELTSSGYNAKPEMSQMNEEEILIDAGGGDSSAKTRSKVSQNKPKKSDIPSSKTQGSNFPSSRGLVSAPFRFA